MIKISSYLKYLERYEEKENDVFFYLKEYHSSKMIGNKIVRELFMFLFHDESLQLNRVYKIDDLTYLVQKEQEYFCLNCESNNIESPIFFDNEANNITMCEFCNWRNELKDTPAIKPIALRTKTLEDYSNQICYPLIEEKDLEEIPEELKRAIVLYFKEPEALTPLQKQNIYHNLIKKNVNKWDKIIKKYQNKVKLALFFQNTKLF